MIGWIERHPNVATWILLAAGMVAALTWSARDVDDLSPAQWGWLVAATVLVAGLCAWIISWEADDPTTEVDLPEPSDHAAPGSMVHDGVDDGRPEPEMTRDATGDSNDGGELGR
jgi:hypothetical protein